MSAIIFCVLWIGAMLWNDLLDVPKIAGALTALAWFWLAGFWLKSAG
jgi:hypothetical protein